MRAERFDTPPAADDRPLIDQTAGIIVALARIYGDQAPPQSADTIVAPFRRKVGYRGFYEAQMAASQILSQEEE